MTTQNITGKFQGYCTFHFYQFNIFFSVLGKEEGDKTDDTKKNWHGHVTVKKKRKNFLKNENIKGNYSCSGVSKTGRG